MSRFGVGRLTQEYEQVTQSVTSAASDMGRSLDDLRAHAARFSQAYSVTRRSEFLGEGSNHRLSLSELLEKKNGVISLQEAFANMQSSERMRFLSAAQWLEQLRKSSDVKLEGNFLTKSGFAEIYAKTSSFIESCSGGASLIHICSALGFDMPVAKEVVTRLIASSAVCVDESVEGVRYYGSIFR